MTEPTRDELGALVARFGRGPDAVVPLLHAIQERHRYLPESALRRVCELTDITPADIAGVSTFYDHFRHRPAGQHCARVCHGTACHVQGSDRVEAALRRHLGLSADQDTDADGRFTVESVACVGCCSLAPVVQVDGLTIGHLNAETVVDAIRRSLTDAGHRRPWTDAAADRPAGGGVGEVRVSLDSCCLVAGADRVYAAAREAIDRLALPVTLRRVGCRGLCREGGAVEVITPDGTEHSFAGVRPEMVGGLIASLAPPPGMARRWLHRLGRGLDRLHGGSVNVTADHADADHGAAAAERRQVRIATEHYGQLDPLDLDAYIERGGFEAWRQALADRSPGGLTDAIDRSGLRGRGGGGFPTARKWALARQQPRGPKTVICNGDEGDPGAFMDRMLMESFPFRVIEGLALAAYAVGAAEAIFYIRHEYPLAVRRIGEAIERCRQRGLLGDGLDGRGYGLRMSIREGAGAFVCGEETALIASIEGRRGHPAMRPPYPVERGLWGRPTVINNVETLANVPWIIRHGPERFAAYGTARSAGTKVFALAGKVRRGGLIEVPMGMSIYDIVHGVGGGVAPGRAFKGVQIGGPSGGCLPASVAHTPVDYEALTELGAIMGSGGLVVLDDRDCIVDLARYFIRFTQAQSCGKCSFCRVGTRRMLDILDRLCAGQAKADELHDLERLAGHVAAASLCGLGTTAPNPVLTALRYFRDEFEAHVAGRCPAGRCDALIRYTVDDACVGCTLCAQHCPADAIPLAPYARHVIDDAACTRCDTCRLVCPHDAIDVN